MQDDQFQVVLGPDPAGVGVHPVFEHVTHRRRCFLVAQSRGEHRWVLRQDVDAVGLLITLERGAPVLDVGHEAPVLRTSPAKSADSVSGASAGEVRHTGAESAASGEPSAAARTKRGQNHVRADCDTRTCQGTTYKWVPLWLESRYRDTALDVVAEALAPTERSL